VSEVATRESEVAVAERAVAVVEVAEVRGDVRVVSDIAAREAPEVAAEAVHARVELLEDNGLRLNVADLLGDDALGHLLENKEALLDDCDALAVANEFLLLLHDGDRGRAEVTVVEVIGAVEVIEVAHGGESTIVVKRARATGEKASRFNGESGGRNTGGEDGKSEDNGGCEFGEHDDEVWIIKRSLL